MGRPGGCRFGGRRGGPTRELADAEPAGRGRSPARAARDTPDLERDTAPGGHLPELARLAGISKATAYEWRDRCAPGGGPPMPE